MMDIGTALVFTVGGIVGSILITQMWQMNYFKRENFKFGLSQKRKEYAINFKKLEKDLGLKTTQKATVSSDTIANLADTFLGGEEDEEGLLSNPVVEGIVNYAAAHPDLTKKVLSQIGINKEDQDQDQHYES